MNNHILSDNELTILRVLWRADEPLSRPEILTQIPNNNWNPNSIHLVLNNLIKKRFIKIEGMKRCGQSYGRAYLAIKTQAEYAANLALTAINEDQEEEVMLDVMCAMVKSTRLSEKTIDLLQQMLDEHRNTLKKVEPNNGKEY